MKFVSIRIFASISSSAQKGEEQGQVTVHGRTAYTRNAVLLNDTPAAL